jgi:hypothetical protein
MPEITPVEPTKEVPANPKMIKKVELPVNPYDRTSDLYKKAKENAEARALPVKPGDMVSFKEMNDWLCLLTPELTENNRIFVYIYRLDPPIIRQKVDPTAPNNIDVIADVYGGIKESYIIDRHGGGKYKFVVRDQEKNNSVGGFFSARLTINQTEHPPKLDLREVDWDNPYSRGYRAYCRANKLIDDNNMPVTPESTKKVETETNSNAMIQAMKLVMEYSNSMNEKQREEFKRKVGGEDAISKTMSDIIIEKMRQEDPNKQLSALTTMLTAMKSMQPEVKPDNTLGTILPIFLQMMTQMNESSTKQFTLMMEVLRSKNEGGGTDKGSVISEVKELFGLFEDMKGGGGKKSTAEVIGSIVETNLTPVLQIVSQVVAMKAASVGVGGMPQPIQPIQPTQQPTTAQPNQPAQTVALPSPTEATQIVSQFGPVILKMLPRDGWEFAAWIADGIDDALPVRIGRLGVDALLNACKQVPAFWSQVETTYGEPYLRKWLESFVNYKEEMKKVQDEDDDDDIITK